MMQLRLTVLALVALLVAGCNARPAAQQSPAPSYLASLQKPSMINPAGTTTSVLQASSPREQLAVFSRMLKAADGQACSPKAARIVERAPDGRSLWNVSCQGDTTKPDFVFFIPASAEKFAQVLRCEAGANGGRQCTAF
jgi:hypothetical protein